MNAIAALAQYGQMKNDTQTMYASPHQLVLMLFDGAIESMSMTIGAIQQKNIEMRGKYNTRAISIINGIVVFLFCLLLLLQLLLSWLLSYGARRLSTMGS